MEPEIIVRGGGRAQVMPDRAVVRIEVDGDGGSRQEAYQQAALLATQVDRAVDAHRDGIARVVPAALAVQPKTRWHKGESVRTGWRASRTTVVEVTDFSHLGDLFAEVAAAGGATAGPFWQVDPTNAVYDEVRQAAAREARQRAAAYATALGVRLGDVAWVAEPGLRPGGGPDHDAPMARMAFAGAGGGAESAADAAIDVTPDEIVVEAAVEVGFSFSTPG